MEFDETILNLRQDVAAAKALRENPEPDDAQLARELAQSIYDGLVDIFGQPRLFAERRFFDDLISLRLPESFTPLHPDVVKRIYPLGNPPQLALSDEPYVFSVGLSYLTARVERNGLRAFAQTMETILTRLGPKVAIVENEMIDCAGEPAARLSFTSQAVDTAVYNVQFFASVHSRVLMGTIHFPFASSPRLLPLAHEIIGSFQNFKKEADLL